MSLTVLEYLCHSLDLAIVRLQLQTLDANFPFKANNGAWRLTFYESYHVGLLSP